jgi:hypothetical protein
MASENEGQSHPLNQHLSLTNLMAKGMSLPKKPHFHATHSG